MPTAQTGNRGGYTSFRGHPFGPSGMQILQASVRFRGSSRVGAAPEQYDTADRRICGRETFGRDRSVSGFLARSAFSLSILPHTVPAR
jgi:hypothetical protein